MNFPTFLHNKEVDKINEAIGNAANEGLHYVWLYNFIPSEQVRKEFEEVGYTVKIFYGDMCNNKDSDTLIKW